MKALAVSDKYGWERFVSLQAFYSLLGRELENELVPLCLDQGMGILVWGPLSGGFLTGKYRREQPRPKGSRISELESSPRPLDEEKGFDVVDELDLISKEHNVTVPQAALNYLLRKPGITSVIIGARTRQQLADNLKTTDWEMRSSEVARLDQITEPLPLYPYWFLTGKVHER